MGVDPEPLTESLGPPLPDRGEERSIKEGQGSEREEEDMEKGQEGEAERSSLIAEFPLQMGQHWATSNWFRAIALLSAQPPSPQAPQSPGTSSVFSRGSTRCTKL